MAGHAGGRRPRRWCGHADLQPDFRTADPGQPAKGRRTNHRGLPNHPQKPPHRLNHRLLRNDAETGRWRSNLKLRVPSIEIAESDVRSLITRVVKAEFDTEQDVYVLSSANREVLTYKNSLERRNLNFRQYYVDGIAIMIGSAVMLLVGFVMGYRKHRRMALATEPGAGG